MTEFVDLCLKLSNPDDLEPMLQTAKRLGYTTVGLEQPHQGVIDVVKRLELHPVNQNNLSSQLRKRRKSAGVLVVQCYTQSLIRQAVNDSRVDLIRLPLEGKASRLSHQYAKLMKTSGVGLEVQASDLLTTDKQRLRRTLTTINRNVYLAQKYSAPIVFTSGAMDVYGLRSPEDLVALAGLLGVQFDEAIPMVSDYPNKIIHENQRKLRDLITSGVYLVT